jgi:hypothetical protein
VVVKKDPPFFTTLIKPAIINLSGKFVKKKLKFVEE